MPFLCSASYSAQEIIALNAKKYGDYTRECAVCKKIAKVDENGVCPVCRAIGRFSNNAVIICFILKSRHKSMSKIIDIGAQNRNPLNPLRLPYSERDDFRKKKPSVFGAGDYRVKCKKIRRLYKGVRFALDRCSFSSRQSVICSIIISR